MDRVASALGMSKRTLYEIFESKTGMIQQTLNHYHKEHLATCDRYFKEAPNVLEGMLKVYRYMRSVIATAHPSFFRDLDEAFANVKHQYRKCEEKRDIHFLEMFHHGVQEGMFRPDVNYLVQAKMFRIQMEALKRMEKLFPPEFTLVEVYDSILIGFLRSIVTPKGMELIDELTYQGKCQPDK